MCHNSLVLVLRRVLLLMEMRLGRLHTGTNTDTCAKHQPSTHHLIVSDEGHSWCGATSFEDSPVLQSCKQSFQLAKTNMLLWDIDSLAQTYAWMKDCRVSESGRGDQAMPVMFVHPVIDNSGFKTVVTRTNFRTSSLTWLGVWESRVTVELTQFK